MTKGLILRIEELRAWLAGDLRQIVRLVNGPMNVWHLDKLLGHWSQTAFLGVVQAGLDANGTYGHPEDSMASHLARRAHQQAGGKAGWLWQIQTAADDTVGYVARSPWGAVGGTLRVLEPWSYARDGRVCYLASGDPGAGPTQSALTMPTSHVRYQIELRGLTMQPLKDVTEEDALACGTQVIPCGRATWTERESLWLLWNKRHRQPHQWQQNPWVWRLTLGDPREVQHV